MHVLEKEVVALGLWWGVWVCFLPLLSKEQSAVSLPIATTCWKVKRYLFAVLLPNNNGSSNRMARPAAKLMKLSLVLEQVSQVCGWSLFAQHVLHQSLWQSWWLLAAVSVSVSASLLSSLCRSCLDNKEMHSYSSEEDKPAEARLYPFWQLSVQYRLCVSYLVRWDGTHLV